MKRLLLLMLIFVLLFSGCVTETLVRFTTDVDGAEIIIDGESIGKTPTKAYLSNAIWSDPDVVIIKEGYKKKYVSLKKEGVVTNLVVGYLIWLPSLLWSYGPSPHQFFILEPEE